MHAISCYHSELTSAKIYENASCIAAQMTLERMMVR